MDERGRFFGKGFPSDGEHQLVNDLAGDRINNCCSEDRTVLLRDDLHGPTRVTMDDALVDLTALEYRTLEYLMQHIGEVVSKTELTEHIYDQDFDRDSNVIEVLINRLRGKLCPDMIQTRRGLGYQLKADEPDG